MLAIRTRNDRIDSEDIHEILRNDRRRRVLQYLKQRLEPVSLRDLAEQIAELEAGTSPAPRNLRQSVYNSLHQTHLPKLDEIGIIEYDKDRKTVVLREGAREVDVYMDVVTPLGLTWSTFYRTLGVLALLSVVLTKTGVPVFADVEYLIFAVIFLAVYALSAAYQLWSRRWFYMRALLGPD